MMNPSTSVQKHQVNRQPVTEPGRKGIKLLKLPWLVQRKILKSMRYTDTFTMSLCSIRMYNLIKTCKIRIPRLFYKESRNGLWVYNRLDRNNNEYIIFVSAVQKYKHDNNQTRVTYGGVSVDFQWRQSGIEYIDKVSGPIQRMTQNHINGLFQLSDIDLELCPENLQQDHYPDIRNVTDIKFAADKMKSDTLHKILQLHPNLKYLDINRIDGPVPEDSKLFEIDNISIVLCPGLTRKFLDNFSGSRIQLYEAELNGTDVVNCVTNWISGRKYHNLIEFHLSVGRGALYVDIIFNSLRQLAKNTVVPDTFECSYRFMGSDKNFKWSLKDENVLHFEREADQKISTLVCHPFEFSLLVWN